MTTYEHTYIETNGVHLHVVLAGPKDGPPLVLLHGFPEYWGGWLKNIPALANAGFRVIVPDQRGYNLSDKPSSIEHYKTELLAADILGLIKALGYEKVNLVGHDWGGIVAWAFGMYFPENLIKLSILNVPHPMVMRKFLAKDIRQIFHSWYVFMFQLPSLPEFLLGNNYFGGAEFMLQASRKPATFAPAEITEYKLAWGQPNALTSMINWYRAMLKRSTSTPRSRRIQAPTLLLWGKRDVALSHRMAQPSIDLCEHGQLIFFEDASHWLQHDKPEEINQLLINFFK